MKSSTFVLIFLIETVFLSPAWAQHLPEHEQERASVLAETGTRPEEGRAIQSDPDADHDVAALINQGYTLWSKAEFKAAREKFDQAVRLDPANERLRSFMNKLEVARLEGERRQAQRRRQLAQERAALDIDRAWLMEDASRSIQHAPEPRPDRETLSDKARRATVSLDFDEAEMRAVLKFLSEVSTINIVMDEAAVAKSGTLSIHLRDVNVVQALESIVRSKGLTYRFENNFIWVSSPENMAQEGMITRIYRLSQGLATHTRFTTIDTVTVEGIRGDNEMVMMPDAPGERSTSTAEAVRTLEGVKIGGPGGIAGNITHTIEDVLRSIVDWPQGSSMFLDHRTCTLIVRNTPTNAGIIDQAVNALDVNPPQVMIEARFVEIGAADLLDVGLDLNARISAAGAAQAHTFPFKKDQATDYSEPLISQAVTPFEVTLGTLDTTQFQAVLSAIEQKTDSNTLSSPKITTVSGQEAIIKVVKEYRYPTKYDVEVYETGSGDNRQTVITSVPSEFKTRDIGIILRVTPNVGADNETINLTMIPEVSEFDIETDMYNYGTEEQPFKQPFFSVRNCTASIIVNNGDTVVLGGLMRETAQQLRKRVPLLGQVPLLGTLFTYTYDNKQKRNLLIFVTARLIAPSGVSVGELAAARGAAGSGVTTYPEAVGVDE